MDEFSLTLYHGPLGKGVERKGCGNIHGLAGRETS